jgi:hypothetical protein
MISAPRVEQHSKDLNERQIAIALTEAYYYRSRQGSADQFSRNFGFTPTARCTH